MLNENIKTLRKNKGFTQDELASRLDVVRQTVSKWEKGYSVPDAELLKKIADIFETDVSTLLGSPIAKDASVDIVSQNLEDHRHCFSCIHCFTSDTHHHKCCSF